MNTPTISRHRRTGPASRAAHRFGTALLLVLALAAGQAFLQFTPDVDRGERPFLIAGTPGADVDARTFTVTVLGARTATVVQVGRARHDTQGVWVLVRVRVLAHREPLAIGYTAVHDGAGRTYLATDRFRQPLIDSARMLQPGIAVEAEIAFEVPVDATGLSLRLADPVLDPRMDAMADVPLPVGPPYWIEQEPLVPATPEVSVAARGDHLVATGDSA